MMIPVQSRRLGNALSVDRNEPGETRLTITFFVRSHPPPPTSSQALAFVLLRPLGRKGARGNWQAIVSPWGHAKGTSIQYL